MKIEFDTPPLRFGGFESQFRIPHIFKIVHGWPTRKEPEGAHITTTQEANPDQLSEDAQAFFRGEVVKKESVSHHKETTDNQQ